MNKCVTFCFPHSHSWALSHMFTDAHTNTHAYTHSHTHTHRESHPQVDLWLHPPPPTHTHTLIHTHTRTDSYTLVVLLLLIHARAHTHKQGCPFSPVDTLSPITHSLVVTIVHSSWIQSTMHPLVFILMKVTPQTHLWLHPQTRTRSPLHTKCGYSRTHPNIHLCSPLHTRVHTNLVSYSYSTINPLAHAITHSWKSSCSSIQTIVSILVLMCTHTIVNTRTHYYPFSCSHVHTLVVAIRLNYTHACVDCRHYTPVVILTILAITHISLARPLMFIFMLTHSHNHA